LRFEGKLHMFAKAERKLRLLLLDSSWHGWPGMRTKGERKEKGVRRNWLRFH